MAAVCAFLLVLALAAGSVSAIEKLSVTANRDGSYSVIADGSQWLQSGAFRVRHEEKFWGPDLGNMVGAFSTSQGSDEIGSYTSYEYTWTATAGSLAVTTYVTDYDDMPVVMFSVQFTSGANATNFTQGDSVRTVSSWPSFAIEEMQGVKRGYVTWSGNMAATIKHGMWSNGIYGDIDGGFPLVMFDSEMKNTVVMSPFNNFMSSTQSTMSDPSVAVTFGPLATSTAIPSGFTYSTILVGGSNVTGTMARFGDILRGYYHKDESYTKSDFTINYLGYWTDNGACYYYTTGEYANYEDALVAVKEDADKSGLPYRYMQIDSWWYYKGPDNGVKNWTAMPSVFPNGIEAVVERTGLRMVAHNRWWSPTTDYAKQNGGKYNFIIDKAGALPLDASFWDFLISSSQKEWSLLVYEQDWLFVQLGRTPELLSQPGLGEMWLQQMGEAAQRYGVTIQYCMPYPRHVLQSVTIPVVTQVRVSDDYTPGNDQWRIGVTTILAHAVGLAAFKDNFHTSSVELGCHNKQNEPAPALETFAAAVSGGPIGPSDHVGMANKTLILATCMPDGRLLKPTRPAMSLDSTFLNLVFGDTGPDGELWAAFTEVGDFTWYNLLAADLASDYKLTPPELPPSRNVFPASPGFPDYIAYNYTLEGLVSTTVKFGINDSLTVPACGKTDFQSWNLAPILPNGLALLGELNKILPVSETRFVSASTFGSEATFFLVGVPGEMVSVTLYNTKSNELVVLNCIIGSSGTAKLDMVDLKCLSM